MHVRPGDVGDSQGHHNHVVENQEKPNDHPRAVQPRLGTQHTVSETAFLLENELSRASLDIPATNIAKCGQAGVPGTSSESSSLTSKTVIRVGRSLARARTAGCSEMHAGTRGPPGFSIKGRVRCSSRLLLLPIVMPLRVSVSKQLCMVIRAPLDDLQQSPMFRSEAIQQLCDAVIPHTGSQHEASPAQD